MIRSLIFIAGAAAIAAAQTYPVAGAIVNTQTGSPMKRVRMELAGPQGQPPAAVETGEDGRFSFEVPKGKYSLTAETNGTRQAYGLEGPAIGFGVSLYVGPGQDVSRLTFHWFPGGVITGTVLDDRHEPVENALVQLIRSAVVAGKRRLSTVGWGRADDRGVYRFSPVTGGTYYLGVTAEPWYLGHLTSARRSPSNQPAPQSEPVPAYAPLYYPSANDLQSAGSIALKPGAEYRADFVLHTISGVNVHVNCPNANGRSGLLSLMTDRIDGVEGPDGFQRQLSFYGRSQTIPGVPPGRYVVRISGSGEKPFSVRKTIDVGASDVAVDLTIQPASSVTGKVTFANPQAHRKATMYVRLVNDLNGAVISRVVEADGSFAFPNVGAAKVRPLISSADGFFVLQASVDGTPLRGATFDIADGDTVNLTLVASDEIGHVKGFVMAGESPVPGVLVLLTPATGSADPAATQVFQTDSDGSYYWANVRAGDYVLFALAQLDLEYLNPAAIRPFLGVGKPMHIDAHREYTERIGLSPRAPKE